MDGVGDVIRGLGRAVAVVSVHASPLAELGTGENGGMNLAIARLCQQLAVAGIPTDVFTRRDRPDGPDEELIAPTSRLIRLPAGPPRPLAKQAIPAMLPEFTAALLDHAASEERRYRLLHAHYWLSGVVAEAAAARWRIPWAQSFHTLAVTKLMAGLPAEPERAAIERRLGGSADRLLAASRAERDELVAHCGADPDRICIVPLGVDLTAYAPRSTGQIRDRLGLSGRRVVLFVGRLERLKGTGLLIEALAQLVAEPRFHDVVVLVAGGDSGDGSVQAGHPGGERGRLERLAADLGMASRVRFIGALPTPDLADLYALADVVAVPSRTESFGLVALEALASGTPVVTTGVGGLRDIIEDGVVGHLVADREPAAFAAALAAVLDDPVRAARMSAEARRRAEHFTWDRSGRRLAAVFDRITEPALAGLGPCGDPAA